MGAAREPQQDVNKMEGLQKAHSAGHTASGSVCAQVLEAGLGAGNAWV